MITDSRKNKKEFLNLTKTANCNLQTVICLKNLLLGKEEILVVNLGNLLFEHN